MDVDKIISNASEYIIQDINGWGMVSACLYIFREFSMHSETLKENVLSEEEIWTTNESDIIDITGSICEEIIVKLGTDIARKVYKRAIRSEKFKDHIEYHNNLNVEYPVHALGYLSFGTIDDARENNNFREIAKKYTATISDGTAGNTQYALMVHLTEDSNYMLNIYSINHRNWVILDPTRSESVSKGLEDLVIPFDRGSQEGLATSFNGALSIQKVLSNMSPIGDPERSYVWVSMFIIMFSMGLRHINDHKYLWIGSDFVIPNSDVGHEMTTFIEDELTRSLATI